MIKLFLSFFLVNTVLLSVDKPLNTLDVRENIILTIPKSGTNLLLKLLFLIDQANGIDTQYPDYISRLKSQKKVSWCHEWKANPVDQKSLGPTLEKINYIKQNNKKIIIIVRDPRALTNAIAKDKKLGPVNKSYTLSLTIENPGWMICRGIADKYFLKFKSLHDLYREYLEWEDHPFVYKTFYESLVGPEGGGDKHKQIQEIINIGNHVGKPITYLQAQEIANCLYGDTATFRKGKISGWSDDFSFEQIQAFLDKNDSLIKELGYN